MSTAVNPLNAISTWSIDPAHSSVHFKVRHMMISNVRGEFRTIRGDLKLNDADMTRAMPTSGARISLVRSATPC